ncbi:MAG: transglutaminase-like domain-containing protein [Candidatus Altiarchaeota archaeon]
MESRNIIPVVALVVFMALGCTRQCPVCDDSNPCTFDYCNDSMECVYTPVDGPEKGCYGTGGCIAYTCMNGSCVSQELLECCGNSACETTEDYLNCPQDCRATCIDGMQNQGEKGVDCGGPCDPCNDSGTNYVNRINALRDEWYNESMEYGGAVNAYNRDYDFNALKVSAIESYSRISSIHSRLKMLTPPTEFAGMHSIFDNTLELYLKSIDQMIKYATERKPGLLNSANTLMTESVQQDREFVDRFNKHIKDYNELQQDCNNNILDGREERVDCGDVCGRDCVERRRITKVVTVENSGYGTSIVLNVTPAAIDYLPYQRLIETKSSISPKSSFVDDDGNMVYSYELDFDGKGIREIRITQDVELNGGLRPSKRMMASADMSYALEMDSVASKMLCPPSEAFRSGKPGDTVIEVYSWMNDNIEYYADELEHGGLYAYSNRKGACDEHADLAAVFLRCLGIPARRVTGFLVNSSSADGHAWVEYYDGGWVYFDPTVKNTMAGMVSDTRHIVTCVGDKAYGCGTTYTYFYNQSQKPSITVTEKTFLS